MFFIRRFEESLLDLFAQGKLDGTTHTYIGQEANAVGIIDHLEPERDVVFSNHRCHGHYLAFTDDAFGLLCEVMGKAPGVCGGKGGSQHLCKGNFYSNGVLGSIVPVATGIALAEKQKGAGAVSTVFLGDGTLGEGVTYESLNIASLWELPVLFVVENNHYAQSTPVELELAGSIPARAAAFGVETAELATTDVEEIHEAAGRAVAHIRETGEPFFLVLDTYRFSPHSKGDDNRDPAEIEERRTRDPLDRGRRAPRRGRATGDRGGLRAARRRDGRGGRGSARRGAGGRMSRALRPGPERGAARALRRARRRHPPRRGRPRPVRRRVQGDAGAERRLPGPRADDPDLRGVALRRRGGDGAAGAAPDPGDHVRRLHRARLRPDRQRDREVPRDVRRPGHGAARRADADGRPPRRTGRRTASRSRSSCSACRTSSWSPRASATTCAGCS